MAVADQVHLLCAGDGEDGLHLAQQLLAAHLGGLEGGHLGHKDIGAVFRQVLRDAVPVINRTDLRETGHAVGEHDGVAGLAIAADLPGPGKDGFGLAARAVADTVAGRLGQRRRQAQGQQQGVNMRFMTSSLFLLSARRAGWRLLCAGSLAAGVVKE